MRSATQPYCNTVEYGCVSLRMRFFPQNFGTIKRILPGSSSPSHREGPGIEVVFTFDWYKKHENTDTFKVETLCRKTHAIFLLIFVMQAS